MNVGTHVVSEVKDVTGTTQHILAQAMAYCAQKVRLDDSQEVIDRLRDGDGHARGYWHYSVAKQVAEYLGTFDDRIKAAYVYDCDATADDSCFGEVRCTLPIHLLVWVDRKTAALKVLAETWDCALAQHYAEMMGVHQPAHLLDVQVVDNADVEKRVGYGALLSSLHHPPIQVWKRQ